MASSSTPPTEETGGRAPGQENARERVRFDFEGRCAVVTGAGSGIGRGIALSLAECGLNVVIADVEEATAESVAEEARSRGVDAIAVPTDVSDADAVARLEARAREAFGPVALLCNNAGVVLRPFRATWKTSPSDWQWVMGVNFWGVLNGVQAFLPSMLEGSGARHIVNVCSMSALRDLRGNTSYVTSKAAMLAFSECLAGELEPEGIGLTIVFPGRVASRIFESERLRPAEERSETRSLGRYEHEPVMSEEENPTRAPEEVGAMVLEAVADRRRYLMTHVPPQETMLERMGHMLGGRVSLEARPTR